MWLARAVAHHDVLISEVADYAAPNALDGDVLIAAQALAEGASVVTPNVRHFEAIVPAMAWRDVPLS